MTTITESNITQTLDLSSFDLSLPPVVVEYPSRSNFPSIGKPDRLYMALDEGMPYRWSPSTNAYASLISVIDGGGF
ncbi:MAG: hypothetical protein NTW41_05490 [Verrucomicrobia bacterium]|nr:hypothetical protein [Verrucomicrobiota bacterium]